ncbi:MAG: TIGR04190 family B12-binding domain/radical SAM domain protein, partial [Vicinamibacterales bacterium]
MRNPFHRDLILLHAPALYDFRSRPAFLGPVADAVPSTAIFEMYPVGLTSIAEYLERNHYNVEIVNVAYRMLRDPGYDVDAHLRRLSAPVFGIDLHWLPHVQGALALAERVKALHP